MSVLAITASSTQSLQTTTSYAFAQDFIQRIAVVAASVAINVYGEDQTANTGHVARQTYARQVLAQPFLYASTSLVWAVIADQTTGPTSTDQAIFNRLIAIWSCLAGA